MTVHFFTRGDAWSADSRQRAFTIVEKLNALGITARIETPPALFFSLTPWPEKRKLFTELFKSLARVKTGDIIYLQRTVSNKYFFSIMVVYLLFTRRKMIFDFCDPIYAINPFKTFIFTRMADYVVVSTHAQVEWAKRHNRHVDLIHIAVDAHLHKKFERDYSKGNARCVIGWVGTGNNHMLNLEILASVFKKLLVATDIPFTFVLVGSVGYRKIYELFRNIPNLDVQFTDALDYLDPESVPRCMQSFDIGVVPQVNLTVWNKGKTSLKILQYMASGIATVASASGELPYIVQDGVNGYIAHTEDEWVEKLVLLMKDKALRERLGRAGQRTAQQEYSFEAVLPKIVEVLQTVTAESA